MHQVRITEINPKGGDRTVIDPKVDGQPVVVGQTGNNDTSCGAAGKLQSLSEYTGIDIGGRTVHGKQIVAIRGTVYIVSIEVLQTKSIRIFGNELIVCNVITQIQAGDLVRRKGITVPAVVQFEVIDIGNVPIIIGDRIINVVISVINCDKGGRILNVDQVVFIGAVVDGNIVFAVVRIVIGLAGVVVVGILSIIVIPRFQLCAVGIVVVIRCIRIQKVRQLHIRRIIVRIIRGIVNRIEGLVVAVNDLRSRSIATAIVVGHVAVLVLRRLRGCGIVFLFFVRSKSASAQPETVHPPSGSEKLNPVIHLERVSRPYSNASATVAEATIGREIEKQAMTKHSKNVTIRLEFFITPPIKERVLRSE